MTTYTKATPAVMAYQRLTSVIDRRLERIRLTHSPYQG